MRVRLIVWLRWLRETIDGWLAGLEGPAVHTWEDDHE